MWGGGRLTLISSAVVLGPFRRSYLPQGESKTIPCRIDLPAVQGLWHLIVGLQPGVTQSDTYPL